jgi:deazaflavin-dependent oxidoreductase (nitroreductase family)
MLPRDAARNNRRREGRRGPGRGWDRRPRRSRLLPMQPITPASEAIRAVLRESGLIDITTTGRTTGQPRRIEIAYHAFDGRVYISGRPNAARRRAWLANLEAQPNFTFHLKNGVKADLPALAREICDPDERRAILTRVAQAWQIADVEPMVAHSPLIEVSFPGLKLD